MVAPVLRESAFVWLCVVFAGGCLAVAVAVRARHFLRELSEQFISLPPTSKAVLVAAIVVATVFAQKPTNESTNQHESAQVETTHTEAHIPRAKRAAKQALCGVSHGEGEECEATNQHESARIEICEDSCQSVDKDSSELRASVSPCEKIVTSNDVVRGYRLETVRTNAAISYTRSVNARLVGTWHLTDAYRGRAWVLLGEEGKGKREKGRSADGQLLPSSLFLFPLGPHVVTSLWAHTWGKVRPQLRNASNEIVVVGAPMFARHGQSYLWAAATTNSSALLTWENFFLGNPYERLSTNLHESTRISIRENSCQFVDHPPVNAQLELFPNGDFIARSNEVEYVYRRVNPDDWDDDGIPNDADDAPLAPSDTPQFGLHQTLPEGANADAYCWVDLVVRQANAHVTFTGDGESNLADPSFIAEADATNRVTFLIGKTYRVTCPMPFEVAAKSSDDIEDSREENGAALWLHWPVSISRKPTAFNTERFEVQRHGEGEDGLDRIGKIDRIVGTHASSPSNLVNPVKETPCLLSSNTSVLNAVGFSMFSDSNTSLTSFTLLPTFQTFSKPSRTFTMQVVPSGIGGAFTWTNVCCRISGSGYTFSITCGDGCACGGCSATGYLEYEGYRLPAYGGSCGCGGSVDHPGDDQDPDKDPPLPGASATFSKRVVFFEDDYESAPGETVPWRSTETELACWAYGGTRGGHVRIEIRGVDGLVQYGGRPLPFEQDLEPGEEVTFKNTYRAVRPSGGEDDIVVTATFTENETEWSQTTVDKATAIRLEFKAVLRAVENPCPNRHRLGVNEKINCFQTPSAPKVNWSTPGGGYMTNNLSQYSSPLHPARNPLIANCQEAEYTPELVVVEPQAIEPRNIGYWKGGAPIGHAGGIGLEFDLYVLPLDVSFSGLAVEEIPCDIGSRSGYFLNNHFTNLLSHTSDNGAGNWLLLSADHLCGVDAPGIYTALPRVTPDGILTNDLRFGWAYGTLTWAIPYGWNEGITNRTALVRGRFAEDTVHENVIFKTGKTGVRKLRQAVTREINGTIYLNGVQME